MVTAGCYLGVENDEFPKLTRNLGILRFFGKLIPSQKIFMSQQHLDIYSPTIYSKERSCGNQITWMIIGGELDPEEIQ
jgi:hypothetical protein